MHSTLTSSVVDVLITTENHTASREWARMHPVELMGDKDRPWLFIQRICALWYESVKVGSDSRKLQLHLQKRQRWRCRHPISAPCAFSQWTSEASAEHS